MLRLLQTCIMVTTLLTCAQAEILEQVQIRNILDGKQSLQVYCRSLYDDFDHNLLPYNATQSLNFMNHFIDTTIIKCQFSWNEEEPHEVNIYMPESPNCRPPNKCFLYVNLYGTCLSHTNAMKFRCFAWGENVYG